MYGEGRAQIATNHPEAGGEGYRHRRQAGKGHSSSRQEGGRNR